MLFFGISIFFPFLLVEFIIHLLIIYFFTCLWYQHKVCNNRWGIFIIPEIHKNWYYCWQVFWHKLSSFFTLPSQPIQYISFSSHQLQRKLIWMAFAKYLTAKMLQKQFVFAKCVTLYIIALPPGHKHLPIPL